MPEAQPKKPLTSAEVVKLLSAGVSDTHSDGRSLYLHVTGPQRGVWKGHYRDGTALRTKSLGGAPATTLAAARKTWEDFRAARRHGLILNPASIAIPALHNGRAAQRRAPAVPTGILFKDAVPQYLDAKAGELRGGRTGKTARVYLADAKTALPDGRLIGDLTWPELHDDVIALHVADMLPRKARDTRIRLRAVRTYMQSGKVKIKEKANHHPSMPWQAIPAFYSELIALKDERANALAFDMLTGIRISDALGTPDKPAATWAEVAGDLWKFAEDRAKTSAKTDLKFEVPLSPAALALLGERKADGERLFSVSYFQVYRLFKKLRPAGANIHGFRASFRTWMQDKGFDREAAEMALQHTTILGDESEQAYKRSGLLEQRRVIMTEWSKHCTSESHNQVSGTTGTGA
jgi:integrase